MTISLRQSLFRILFGGVIITAVLILINVWSVTSRSAVSQVNSNLDIAQGVLQQVLADRRQQLANSASVLTADYGFKQAVATGDIPTIESALQNYSERINADFMLVTDFSGTVLTSNPTYFTHNSQFPYPQLVTKVVVDGIAEAAVVVQHGLYQLIMLPVRAPTPVAVVGIGFLMDDEFLSQVKSIVQADIIVYQSQKDIPQNQVLHSSFPLPSAEQILADKSGSINWLNVTLQGKQNYITRELLLPQALAEDVGILLAVDVTEQFQVFTDLQMSILGISLAAIIASLLVSLRLSRRVTGPVQRLLEAVNKVSKGEYSYKFDESHQRVREIAELTSAFSTMKENIQTRETRIRFQAQHDMLTGLFNREHIEQIIESRFANHKDLQIIGINIHDFRAINDLYGYTNGDVCLQRLAERIKRWLGDAARLSGGELLWLPRIPMDEMQLETVHNMLEQSIETQELVMPIKIKMAVLNCPSDADSTQDVFRKMNILFDEAEVSQSWLMRFDMAMEKNYVRRLTIITELKQALQMDQDELSMVYQPKIDLASMQVRSLEALVRWNSKVLGFVPPDEFISIAEQAGIIAMVTEWVMGQVIRDLSLIKAQNYNVSVAINLSTQDIQNRKLLDRFIVMLKGADLTEADVSLEITESDLVEDAEVALRNLEHLRELGFSLAIDDFGTGYSSLAYLKNLPVSTIKIDKSFVLNLKEDEADQKIVRTILNLAKVFSLTVIAEGVEDEDALKLLTAWGCDTVQGYFISRPLKRDDLIDWLELTEYYH
jgi:diguanylate cyclase (GGDEF)-like protein